MFRFFRKIRYRLLDEGHLSKYTYYAIGEILLVVIGILIAIQINNWNEERNDKSLEQQYLLRLLDDMERSYQQQTIELEQLKEASKNSKTVVSMLIQKSITDESREEFNRLFNASIYSERLSHDMTTIRQILDSNHLSIFQSEAVRKAITNNSIRYDILFDAEKDGPSNLYRNALEALYDQLTIDPFSRKILNTNEDLNNNPLIHRKLHMISRTQRAKAFLHERMRQRTIELRDIVKNELAQ